MLDKLQEKLKFLLDKYSVNAKIILKDSETVIADGEEIPIFPHRYERRFIELKNTVQNGTLRGVSVMRTARIVEKGTDIYGELYREFDICRFVLARNIKYVTAFENGCVLNVLAKCCDGVVCTLEIAATLKNGESPKDKHEVISQRGIACDVVVDAQLRQDSIYVFGDENKKYTDVDFELYGLSAEEASVVRAAFAVGQNRNHAQLKNADTELKTLVALAEKSAKSGEREVLL